MKPHIMHTILTAKPSALEQVEGIIETGTDDVLQLLDAGVPVLAGVGLTILGTTDYIGLRFQDVQVGNAQLLRGASLTMWSVGTPYLMPQFEVFGELTANSPAFQAISGNVSNRARTMQKAAFAAGTSAPMGPNVFDVLEPVQEVINQAGWVAGNALSLILKGTGVSALSIDTYDLLPSKAARLKITW